MKGTKYFINRAIGIAIKCMYITFRIRYEQSLLGRSTVKFQDIRKIASKRGLKVAKLNKRSLSGTYKRMKAITSVLQRPMSMSAVK